MNALNKITPQLLNITRQYMEFVRWKVLIEVVHILHHYYDVIMGAMASQITSLNSTVSSGADQSNHQSSAPFAFVENSPGTGEFPAQMVSTAENVSIWWRHHVILNMRKIEICLLQSLKGWHELYTLRPRSLHIEAETKWPPFRRRHFDVHFLQWKRMNFD